MSQQKESVLDTMGIICIAWFVLWSISIPFLPETSYAILLVALGFLPLTLWFLVRPTRIKWAFKALLGFDALKK
ncbi:MAG: hypothetical protein ABW153_10805 [Sedimenticola sp.]